MRGIDRRLLLRLVGLTLLGGLAGSRLLLVSSNDAFSMTVPFLLLAATAAFAFGGGIAEWMRGDRFGLRPNGNLATVLVSIYGGYFNGGLGIRAPGALFFVRLL